ncbi:MAG: response regulator [Cyanobacteria bacterium]|nr:response regulator [Cyanobacteriota bacterium]MDW8201919.1 adenylate/guanylate cyclase domain-containing protein [Cyanobacteriota bacterium SKYGB_h_bin112]
MAVPVPVQRTVCDRCLYRQFPHDIMLDPQPAVVKGDILVVDDTPDNLRLLSTMLTEQGYKVRSAISGAIALMGVNASPPDLILLDINMPEMDGYQVCQALKANEVTHDIPVIFVSAYNEVLDKVKSFAVGGVDYITKPFQMEEVVARIDCHLSLWRLQQQLQQQQLELQHQNARLQQEIAERQQAEQALKQAEAKYRSIVENAVEGIYQVTPNGKYISANPSLARILGYGSPSELMQQVTNVSQQLYVEPSRLAELAAYLQRYDVISEFESQVYCKDGSTIWIAENVRCVRDDEGNVLYYEGMVQDVSDRRQTEVELRQERQKTERLLLNILPQPIAQRLKGKPQTIADNFEDVTVLFADIVDFTQLSAHTSPTQLIDLLNEIFSAFDQIAERYGLEKVKTIGDAYMAAAGLPMPRADHAQAVAEAALAMQQAITNFHYGEQQSFQLRIGINTGPVIAGVIGMKKFAYDLWGDTVNVASRMESQGEAGKIQVTDTVYDRLKEHFSFEKRGSIAVKGKGMMTTYWLTGKLPTPASSDGD